MSTIHQTRPLYRVGEWVSFQYGPSQVWAQITEDRGTIGVKGRRLYRIRLGENSDESEALAFEVPELDLAPAKIDREKVLCYFKQGGLIEILRSNLGGGSIQPKVWLAFDSQGEIIHTFHSGQGLLGGVKVPFFALHENRVFSAKVGEVIEFLSSFGLNREQSADVIKAVGEAP